MRKRLIGATGALLAAAALPAALMSVPSAGADPARPGLATLVTLKDLRRHLAAFQEIADYNGGNRAAGRPGSDISVRYVEGRLRKAGLKPVVQRFTFPYWREKSVAVLSRTAPHKASYKAGRDFLTMAFSGSGDVTGPVAAVDVPSSGEGTSGCEAADFTGLPAGAVALVQRGACSFETKASRARAAGAGAVLIFNRAGEKGPIAGTVGTPQALPVLGVSHRLGAELAKASKTGAGSQAVKTSEQAGASKRAKVAGRAWAAGPTVRVKTHTVHGNRSASNVVADTEHGRAGNVVLAGAHLDSVRAGPGINDNATGAAALLAVAEKIGALGAKGLRNRVRFAWWGAEEEGLRGSSHYVRTLTDAERRRIALNLNFDMLGSVNGVRGVYDGDHSTRAGSKAPSGSGAIEKMFRDYFARRGLATVQAEFNGRSDYGPFVERGIPAGGLESGADGVKTAAEAKAFGGSAGKVYDPCYHARCDRLKNVDLKLFDTNADAVAWVVEHLAATTVAVNGQSRLDAARGPRYAPAWQGPLLVR
ncbi:M28 family peptidase [Actinomadura graeca]|uniref:M28 family peptidase n=1 Tax=Actinomadura graeca TaxID=2750812 RepID=A0ABX8QTR5_9ACTN|nr:M28 family peptidase [Actinomadura graeca]QXJ21761.1 M28 family peptidase [Actinomadura graeca]